MVCQAHRSSSLRKAFAIVGGLTTSFRASVRVCEAQVIDEGKMGRLLLIEASTPYFRSQDYDDSVPWRGTIAEDGGALMNQGIHQIDLLIWFGGQPPSVYGKISTFTHEIEAEDMGIAIVKFASGCLGTIMSSTSVSRDSHRKFGFMARREPSKSRKMMRIIGRSKGSQLRENKTSGGGESGPLAFFNKLHRKQIANMLYAIEHGAEPLVTGEDGRRAVVLVNGIYKSSSSGTEVVFLLNNMVV